MAKRIQFRRLFVLTLLLSLAFTGLGYRLVDLQVLRHDELSNKAQQNTQRAILLEPRRGDIVDAKGNLLATSIFVKKVCADPTLIGPRYNEVARAIAPLLEIDEVKLAQQLTPRLRQNQKGETLTNSFVRYVCLKKKVPVETWEKIQTAMTNLTFDVDEKTLSKAERAFYRNLRQKSIFAEQDQLRVYPNQALAAHVLGFTATEEIEVNGTGVSQMVGKEGIECTLDAKLAGTRGWRLTETDRLRRELVTLREQNVEPRDGLNVVLTIDSVIQHITEKALADAMEKHSPISASAVVLRPRTGEILAMATVPNFDPNSPGKYKDEYRKNRVICDIAEPGSTFKVVVVSAALNEGIVRLTDVFDCEQGRFSFGGRILHDHDPYGAMSVERIITKSSNIGSAKIGIRLGENRLYDYICKFGFGSLTGLPLPGEVSAKLFVPPVKKWSKVSIAQIPMGHGVSVTRLQMAMAMCAIANGGWLMRPMIVDRLEDGDHKVVAKYSPQRVRQVISESAAKQMVEALKTVVATNGTAPKAALEHYTVAGKTGTAQKVENGVYVRKYFSSFIGFFPADNPELCISVTLDEPKHGYYGGQTAAPVFRQIAERAANYLNIRPENGDALSAPDTNSVPQDKAQLKNLAARSRENSHPE
ncbi:MAG TPA: penicillin-binding protein 2 [Clostridia bacterium]|nr:penicillin-binding protein 2 [Clostridia bacterium]